MAPQIIQGQRNHGHLPKREDIPQAYRDIAKGMEQQFVQFMIEQMKKTAPPANPESSATKFYQSMLTQRHADIMATKNGGLGLQKMILDQIYPQAQRKVAPKQAIEHYQQNSQRADKNEDLATSNKIKGHSYEL